MTTFCSRHLPSTTTAALCLSALVPVCLNSQHPNAIAWLCSSLYYDAPSHPAITFAVGRTTRAELLHPPSQQPACCSINSDSKGPLPSQPLIILPRHHGAPSHQRKHTPDSCHASYFRSPAPKRSNRHLLPRPRYQDLRTRVLFLSEQRCICQQQPSSRATSCQPARPHRIEQQAQKAQ